MSLDSCWTLKIPTCPLSILKKPGLMTPLISVLRPETLLPSDSLCYFGVSSKTPRLIWSSGFLLHSLCQLLIRNRQDRGNDNRGEGRNEEQEVLTHHAFVCVSNWSIRMTRMDKEWPEFPKGRILSTHKWKHWGVGRASYLGAQALV